ncbi:VTT domain-containing protein [Blastopirellula sp. JC732]|uniref:VTT domain-containing protein n=1 Tax=Blastopirellula sediminis TaxID=2894196 RepID=A0A9X1MQ68_9BACT|nr:VTT domain-containing protein [Blastopirellula sediminis]MCC9606711.1 VTT domain-containing protein [Blastopirellula sediminis]MCC9629992.1 VTT domain-containing protein [Blastopirellula sediminis]
MRTFLKWLFLIGIVLLAPIVPLLFWETEAEAVIAQWSEHPPTPLVTALIVFTLLATDIFLPVPSSVVSTLAGSQLGMLLATLVCWAGMTAGAVVAFWLARKFGDPIVRRYSKEEDVLAMRKVADRIGPWGIALTRALPILAEAMVLLLGASRLEWRRFLPPTLLANLGIALAYAAFGELAAQHEWILVASGISAAAPLLLTWFFRRHLRDVTDEPSGDQSSST